MFGFDQFRRRNEHGGGNLVPYSHMTLEEIDGVLASTNLPWQPVAILPDKYMKAGPKEHRAQLSAIYDDFRKVEKACEPLSVSNAQFYFDKWTADAIASGEPGDAPVNKNEVKDRMRNLRRELRAKFKERAFCPYHTMVKELLEAIIPGLTKLIEKENAEDAARLKAFGIAHTFPSPVVAGLYAVRRYLIGQLVFAEGTLQNGGGFGVSVDPELLRFLGCEI
jgi:hypothetical protein